MALELDDLLSTILYKNKKIIKTVKLTTYLKLLQNVRNNLYALYCI